MSQNVSYEIEDTGDIHQMFAKLASHIARNRKVLVSEIKFDWLDISTVSEIAFGINETRIESKSVARGEDFQR